MKSNQLKYSVLILFISFSISVMAQKPLEKALFVGNSLTKYEKNKMTEILQKFIEESNYNLQVDVKATNGARLNHHTQTIEISKKRGISYGIDTLAATTMKQIINGNYDLIVLQDPDWMMEVKRRKDLYPAIKFIDSNSNAQLLFYQVVPSFIGPRKYCYGCSIKYTKHAPDSIKIKKEELVYKTIEQQMDTIRAVGHEITSDIAPGSLIIPSGEIVYQLSKKLPHESMVIGGEHPSKIVQYALALTFYTYMTKQDPRELKYSFKLKDGDAKLIREMVYNYWSDNSDNKE